MNQPRMNQLRIEQLCHQFGCHMIEEDSHAIQVAGSHAVAPNKLVDAIKFASGKSVVWHVWGAAQLESAQQHHATALTPPDGTGDDVKTKQLLEYIIQQALKRRASDIHLEPKLNSLSVRLRIDGVLQPLPIPNGSETLRIVPRLKVMAELDIAERRIPQDGQLNIALSSQSATFRISTLPTRLGEKVVLRQVQDGAQPFELDDLGFEPQMLSTFKSALNKPQGLILVTGPTGSGKTATLYSSLNYLHSPERNICSVEDPVESPLEGINQTAINTKAALGFTTVLRALLRQDPDVIMIGEIRDAETAEIAVNAAQTGHLVLSTLHTNSASETLVRLSQLNVKPYLIAASLSLVIAQRLVRKLCQHCRQRDHTAQKLTPSQWQGDEFHHWIAAGCEHCFNGYYGRKAVYEILPISREIQLALLVHASALDIHTLSQQQGVVSLWQAGLQLAHRGETSLAEVVRVLGSHYADNAR